MKKIFPFMMASLLCLQVQGQMPCDTAACLQFSGTCPNIPTNPEFSGSMTQEQLESYLSKSIVMTIGDEGYSDTELCEIICNLQIAQPKYIARIAGTWSANDVGKFFSTYENIVCKIHSLVDENIICGTAIYENIGAHGTLSAPWANGIGVQTPNGITATEGSGKIPQYVKDAFPGYNGSDYWCYINNYVNPHDSTSTDPDTIAAYKYYQYPGNQTPDPQGLIDYRLMGYDYPGASFYDEPGNGYTWEKWPDSNNPQDSVYKIINFTPDITKIQTKMWYYWLGTTYIDLGFEAIHIGQIGEITDNDPDLTHTRQVLDMIRNYADSTNALTGRTFARRGLVLINGGRKDGYELDNVFDFVKVNARIKEAPPFRPDGGGNAIITTDSSCSPSCTQGVDYYKLCHYQPNKCNNPGTVFDAIYGNAPSGTSALGFSCAPCPYLVEIDHSGNVKSNPGMRTYTESANDYGHVYGLDEISWFAEQDFIPGYQEDWVQYAYFKVNCFDNVGFLEMPGIRQVKLDMVNNSEFTYEVSEGLYALYHDIWYNSIFPVKGRHYNFTDSVSNNPIPDNVSRSLTVLRDSRMYFINTGNTVQGYLYSPSSGKWLPTSPYWTAHGNGFPASNQIPAADNLVANTSGNRLYYRNNLGKISVYNMVGSNIWDWTYEDLPTPSGFVSVGGSVVPVGDNSIFYIGTNNRIYGYYFNNNQWTWFDPGYNSSNLLLLFSSKTTSNHQSGALAANLNGTKLFYINQNNTISGYNILGNPVSGFYPFTVPSQGANTAIGGLACTTNDDLYYIGSDSRIHGFTIGGFGQYEVRSPSSEAQEDGHCTSIQQPATGNNIAVSTEGSRIFYLGTDGFVHGFNKTSTNHYSYFDIEEFAIEQIRDLRAIYDDEVFFISNRDFNVHHYKFEQDNCGILPIRVIESCGQISALSAPSTPDVYEVDVVPEYNSEGLSNLTIIPNPASSNCHVSSNFRKGNNRLMVLNYSGQMINEISWNDEVDTPKTINLDFSKDPKGIYLCVYLNNGTVISQQKIVITK